MGSPANFITTQTKSALNMLIGKFLLCPILFIFFGQTALAEQYSKISLSSLTWRMQQPTITCIYKDSRGLLWIGTQKGLYRFDGAELTHFNSDRRNRNWIPASDIRGIDESRDGGLLIATYGGGLLQWNEYFDLFEPPRSPPKSTHKFITHLIVSKSGRIWIGTKDTLTVYESDSPKKLRWIDHDSLAC
jgi:ligand-binding sensor domain-containing protein